jgi:hypothetical protein
MQSVSAVQPPSTPIPFCAHQQQYQHLPASMSQITHSASGPERENRPPPQLDNGNTHMHANPSVLCSDGKSGKATLRFLHLNTCHAKQFCKIPARQIRNPLPAHLFVHETKRSGKPSISYLASRISPWFIKSCHTQPNLAACMYRAKLASSFWPAPVSRRACWYRVFKVPSGSSESSSSSGAL